jgi:hypothetical protein
MQEFKRARNDARDGKTQNTTAAKLGAGTIRTLRTSALLLAMTYGGHTLYTANTYDTALERWGRAAGGFALVYGATRRAQRDGRASSVSVHKTQDLDAIVVDGRDGQRKYFISQGNGRYISEKSYVSEQTASRRAEIDHSVSMKL